MAVWGWKGFTDARIRLTGVQPVRLTGVQPVRLTGVQPVRLNCPAASHMEGRPTKAASALLGRPSEGA
ncbi:hypothetical protein GCM10022295_34780 [Streptomyces osmaniensis]|uniref:Uncharacterized protein n=1 Tax=Streptomyces osmaniensis TaxID=593134 RepID=A0ABP6WES3_9ACTN